MGVLLLLFDVRKWFFGSNTPKSLKDLFAISKLVTDSSLFLKCFSRRFFVYLFSTNIGKLLGLFSWGATIEATPSTNDNSYAISDNTIGWPICHLSISKKSLTVATHLSNTSF